MRRPPPPIWFEHFAGIYQMWVLRRFVFGFDAFEFWLWRVRHRPFRSRRLPGVIGWGPLYFQDARGKW